MPANRIPVFIGSSVEGLGVAQAIQLELEHDAVCTIWYQGVFGLGEGTLESLEAALTKYQFAILVLTPDDVATVRGDSVQLPRDNVLLELGLFIGHLGRRRVFVVYQDSENIKLPTDLAGVTIGAFRVPDSERSLRKLSTTDLMPLIGPVVSRIRSSIQKVREEQGPDVCIHLVAPTLAHNEFYAHLQTMIEGEISKQPNLSWRFCPPKGPSAFDMYAEFETVLKGTRPQDAVLLVPRDLENARLLQYLRDLLDRCRLGRVVFIDQPPPAEFLRTSRFSFVGSDDRKVGILAGLALHERMRDEPHRVYCGVAGPGGRVRVQGFVDAMARLEKDSVVEVFDFADSDRIENLPHVTQLVRSLPDDAHVGIFAGNDETALGILQAAFDNGVSNLSVVGCDSTREMRLAVDGKNPAALATIDIDPRGQAQKIVQAAITQMVEMVEPQLYPLSLKTRRLINEPGIAELWRGHT